MNRFIMRIVQWEDTPPQINVVCKRCLSLRVCRTVFDIFEVTRIHSIQECEGALVSDFTGVPEPLGKR